MKNSAIDWDKIEEKELKYKGYNEQDIQLLILLKKDGMNDLSIDVLKYYLSEYIHNKVICENENKRLQRRLELVREQRDICKDIARKSDL